MKSTWLITALLITIALAGCLPDTEISQETAAELLAVNKSIKHIARLTADSFQNTQINNPSLQPYLANKGAATITGSCSQDKGSYLFSKSEESRLFSLVLDQCADNDGSIINGTLNGAYTVTGSAYSLAIAGNLNTNQNDITVALSPMNLGLEFKLNGDMPSYYISQEGTYRFQSSHFKGDISVATGEPVGINAATLEVSGQTTYTDSSGNFLTVEHTNNGVHLYFNDTYVNTFSHRRWHQLFG